MDWRCLPLHGAPQHLLPRGDDSGPGDVRRARSGGAGGVRRLQSQLAGRGSEPAERWQLGLRPHARRAAGGASGESEAGHVCGQNLHLYRGPRNADASRVSAISGVGQLRGSRPDSPHGDARRRWRRARVGGGVLACGGRPDARLSATHVLPCGYVHAPPRGSSPRAPHHVQAHRRARCPGRVGRTHAGVRRLPIVQPDNLV
mmetsp:Transcript_27422/g.51862  ORF Transcript_27422/g.51862 Transcript_27422/m.51862 type:complete len:202 (-) Transcript_27422:96-701(-)